MASDSIVASAGGAVMVAAIQAVGGTCRDLRERGIRR